MKMIVGSESASSGPAGAANAMISQVETLRPAFVVCVTGWSSRPYPPGGGSFRYKPLSRNVEARSTAANGLGELCDERLVCRYDSAGFHEVAAIDLVHDTARLANENSAGGDVPYVEVAFPIAVEAAGGDISEIKRRGAEAAD